jgi:REP element-mobilizing transposase RayT
MTTNEYIKEVKSGVLPPFDKRIWQRSFYDHIIRKNESFNKIREYIIINPQEWNNDEFNITTYK